MIADSLKKYAFFRLPQAVVVAGILIVLMGTVVSFLLSDIWATRKDYGFGYLMPMFALYVIYDRFPKILAYFQSPAENIERTSLTKIKNFATDAFFAAMAFCGLSVFFLFAAIFIVAEDMGSAAFPMTFGFSFTFFAMTYFAASQRPSTVSQRLAFCSLFVFPAFAWIISAPMFSSLENIVSLFLLSKVAIVVAWIMNALGFVVEIHGNSLEFPNGSVGVADACSGIRSLTACLFAGSFLATVFLDKFWKKILLVGMSMCLAFFNNLLRALFLSLWAYENGSESIQGFVHDAAGYFVLIMTVIGLMILLPIFQFSIVPKEFQSKNGEKNSE